MRALSALSLAALNPAGISAESFTLLSPGSAYVPVPFMVNASSNSPVAFATVDRFEGAVSSVSLLRRNDSSTTGPWIPYGVVASQTSQTAMLSSGMCVQLPAQWDSALVCAYQNRSLTGRGGSSIKVARSGDYGVSWATIGTAAVSDGPGLWQPFLYLAQDAGSGKDVLRMVYAADQAQAGGDSWLVQAQSTDAGGTWTPLGTDAIIAITGAILREPGVTSLSDGSLLLVFERTPTAGGSAWVQAVRSFNGGAGWEQLVDVFVPPPGSNCNAGAPKAAVCLLTDKINVVFLTDLPVDGSGCPVAHAAASVGSGWLDSTSLGLVAGFLDANNASAPLNFTGAPLARIPAVGDAPVTAPSVFVDVQSAGASSSTAVDDEACSRTATTDHDAADAKCAQRSNDADGSALTHTMRVAYYTPGGGGGKALPGAYMSDGTLCLS